MNIKIFDVRHGFCSLIFADNNNLILIDCGSDEPNFSPTSYLKTIGCNGIESFIISNYDEDHLSDLPSILANYHIDVLYRNDSITPSMLESMKLESGYPLSTAMQSTLDLVKKYYYPVADLPDFAGITTSVFFSRFPTFKDTNNLSIVTFIEYDGFSIVYPGDLEKTGWDKLLENSSFQTKLANVDIFVASHHGREGGYNSRVFDYCNPSIVIISDKEMLHETQKNCYTSHAKGVLWNGGPEKRYVLTTRNDGHINIDKNIGKGFCITTNYSI
jgi:beta-lactamase superfamily II metal-dependent hydrolase